MMSTKLSYLWRELFVVKWVVLLSFFLVLIISCNRWIGVGKIDNSDYLVWAEWNTARGATVPFRFRVLYYKYKYIFGIDHKLMDMTSCNPDIRFALSKDNILFYSTFDHLKDCSKEFFIANLDCPGDGFEVTCNTITWWNNEDTLADKISGLTHVIQSNLKDYTGLIHIDMHTEFRHDENGRIINDGASADLFIINAEKTELIDIWDKNIVFAVKWYCRNKPDTFSLPLLDHEKMAIDQEWMDSIFMQRGK